MEGVDLVDIRGTLETIKNLAAIGMLLIAIGQLDYIPTLLEDIQEHSQRLTLAYAVEEEPSG